MRTSVIIATYTTDRLCDLCEAVRSVQRQTVQAAEIIVGVDRNPVLASRIAAAFPQIRVIENTQHPGAGGVRNSAALVARGEYLAFLDDDAIAAPDWIEQLERSLAEERVIGVGGLIEPLWLATPPRWFPSEFGWVVGCSYRGLPGSRVPVRNVISANMGMRRSLFAALGGFRDGFGKQGDRSEPEETELCIRAGQRWPERSWVYEPRMRIQHRVPASRLRFHYFVRRCLNEGIGKAALASLVGSSDALKSERDYVKHVLPTGIARGVRDCMLGRDPRGVMRAATIAIGAVVTAAGYLVTRGQLSLSGRSSRKSRTRSA